MSCELGACCSDAGLAIVLNTIRRIVLLFQIIVPILLMVTASIKFTQLVVDPERKKGLNQIRNIFLAAGLIFFIPMFVNVVLNMLPDSFELSACWEQSQRMAEASKSTKNQYISLYDKDKRSSILMDPDDYEKGSGGGGGNVAPGNAKGIIEGAETVHTMYEQEVWAYYTDLNQLRWNDIKYSTNNPSKMTCCATFVGSAFYVGGVFSESVLNQYNYNSALGINSLCQDHNWIKITSYSQLAAGDIVIMSGSGRGSSIGHVQIYAGNGTWYNAGSTSAIQRANPYASDGSSRFLWAWRKPA